MKRLLIIISLLLIVAPGCKQQDVNFSNAPSTPLDPPGNQGNTVVEPEPEPQPEPQPEPNTPVPPVVKITRDPSNHLFGDSTQVGYKVVPGDEPVVELICQVDGSEIPCGELEDSLELSGFAMGEHKVHIEAIDEKGLKGNNHSSWNVVDRFVDQNQDINVEIEEKLSDVLFVIDNSGSMQVEQAEVARRIGNFFGQIKKVDWRVGIITTDPYEKDPVTNQENPLADGALLPYPNGQYFIDRSLDIDAAGEQFAQTIFRPEIGNGHERGIHNTYRAIERSLNPFGGAKNLRLSNFFRNQASLSVVLISDENETLVNGVGNPLENLQKSDGRNLINFVKSSWGQDKTFQFNSIIVRPDDQDCIGPDESFGHAYDELSNLTGGIVEDICAADYSGALKNIGAGVANLQKVYQLNCQAEDVDQDGNADLQVVGLQGQSIPSYVVTGDSVEFDEPLSEGEYKFNYSCLNSVP